MQFLISRHSGIGALTLGKSQCGGCIIPCERGHGTFALFISIAVTGIIVPGKAAVSPGINFHSQRGVPVFVDVLTDRPQDDDTAGMDEHGDFIERPDPSVFLPGDDTWDG